MAKAVQARSVKRKAPSSNVELRRWCIEMAMRWPMISNGGYGNAGSYQSLPRVDTEADVINRAGRILAWVEAT